jgi:hypothetical protein
MDKKSEEVGIVSSISRGVGVMLFGKDFVFGSCD